MQRVVEAAAPRDVPQGVVPLRPLALEQRLGPAVLPLLLQKRAHRTSSVMPDNRSRAETERETLLLQPPADIDVVARDPELLVEAVDRLEACLSEGHVAAGDVLGLPV